MSGRAVKEWIGKTPDAMPPPSVFRRLWRKQKGRCPKCTRKLTAGNVTREHVKPIWAGGENRERNIELWYSRPCSSAKTSAEATRKAKADRCLDYQLGLKAPSAAKKRPFPGSRQSPWKRKVDGTVVPR